MNILVNEIDPVGVVVPTFGEGESAGLEQSVGLVLEALLVTNVAEAAGAEAAEAEADEAEAAWGVGSSRPFGTPTASAEALARQFVTVGAGSALNWCIEVRADELRLVQELVLPFREGSKGLGLVV